LIIYYTRILHHRKLVANHRSLSARKQRNWLVLDRTEHQLNEATTRSKLFRANYKFINQMHNHSFKLRIIKQLICQSHSAETRTLELQILQSIFTLRNLCKFSSKMSKFRDSLHTTSHFCRVKIVIILLRCKIYSYLIRSVLRINRLKITNKQKFKIL